MEYQQKLRQKEVLGSPSKHGLLEIFETLKWGRKALDQNLLDSFSQQVKDAYEKAEKAESPEFESELEEVVDHLSDLKEEGEFAETSDAEGLKEEESPVNYEKNWTETEEKTEDNE
jgi:hypothetical protein